MNFLEGARELVFSGPGDAPKTCSPDPVKVHSRSKKTAPNSEISGGRFFCDVIFGEFSSSESNSFCGVILSPRSCTDGLWLDDFGHLGILENWCPSIGANFLAYR